MRLTDPQVWTLIGVFAAVMLGGMTLMTTQLSRIIRVEVDRVEGSLTARIDRVEGILSARIDGIDGIDGRLGRIESTLGDLDTELTNLATRFWRSQ
ncbi:hypothetical protein [Microbacterium maritypicum]|uniref:Uncharacterized protein n=1 Tax=Microbacterium maritypicum MF109 TaxID=1333857 RepID=T5KBA1_MICMQ|nr:hypothetical protein [Microbacterium liquefaciens]EQM72807.1 hypothetical protein L687_08995 [Microbacterium maritypicum MF109]